MLVFCLDYRNFPQVGVGGPRRPPAGEHPRCRPQVHNGDCSTAPALTSSFSAPTACALGPTFPWAPQEGEIACLPASHSWDIPSCPLQGNALDMLTDVNTGIGWVLRNAAAFGGDGKSFHLVGQSAGGQLGALALLAQVRSMTRPGPGAGHGGPQGARLHLCAHRQRVG